LNALIIVNVADLHMSILNKWLFFKDRKQGLRWLVF